VVKDFKVSYVTHGKLNKNRDNAILVMHHWGGDHHNYDFLIGPGKPFDPEKYFIIATDTLGNSKIREDVTTGPTNSGLAMDFPHYTLRDSVNLEYRLTKDYLGLERLLAVSGISVGALKSFQFAVSYPTYVRGVIPMMGNAATTAQTRMIVKDWMDILTLDAGWQGGNYEINPTTGVALLFRTLTPWVFTYAWSAANLKTPEAYRSFMQGTRNYWGPQDARDLYYQAQSWIEFNVGDTAGFNGNAHAALHSIKAKVLIIGAKDDLLFGRDDLVTIKNDIPGSVYLEIDSLAGHAACCGNDEEANKTMGREIASFLSRLR